MFIGTFSTSMQGDSLSIPLSYASQLGSPAIMCKGLDNCYVVQTQGNFQEYVRIFNPDSLVKEERTLARRIYASAEEVLVENEKLFVTKGKQRELQDQLLLVGMGKYFEIWNANAFSLDEHL